MNTNTKTLWLLLFVITPLLFGNNQNLENSLAQDPAMELGGIVTVDYGGPIDALGDATAKVGTVELSANVPISKNILASVTLLSGGDLSKVVIDAAVVEWNLIQAPVTILFGQNNLGHGLLTTHLISDPLLGDLNFGLVGPSLSSTITLGSIAPFSGVVYLPGEVNSTYSITGDSIGNAQIEHVSTEGVGHYRGVVGAVMTPIETVMVRASSSFGKKYQDAVVGSELELVGLVMDLEGYYKYMDGELISSGWYSGLAYGVSDMIELAVRYDMITQNNYKDFDMKMGGGVSLSFDHGIFCALEFNREMPHVGDEVNSVALQFGLESSLELPGFQRKTLLKN